MTKLGSRLVGNLSTKLIKSTQDIHIDLAALNRRAATLKTKRCVKKAYQAAWLLRACTCIDLTTLAGDDTDANVQRLCFKVSKKYVPL